MNRAEAKEEIKRRIPCSSYLQKSKGKLYCCPFCGSGTHRSPNSDGALEYYPETNTVYCHSCRQAGDVFDLVMNDKGIDFNAAFSLLAEEAGITVDKYTGNNKVYEKPTQMFGEASDVKTDNSEGKKETDASRKKEDRQQETDLTEYFRQCKENLKNSPAAISYLNGRGISLETALSCNIGFDEKADPAGAGHPTERLIIPTTKSHYVGRRIDGIKEYAKINNKGGSPGIFNCKEVKSGAGEIFVTEGAFDAMSISEAGGKAVAINSTSNTDKFLSFIGDLKPEGVSFIVCFDADPEPETRTKTEKAAEELKAGLLDMGYKAIAYFPLMEEGEKDLNDVLTISGKEKVKAIINEAKEQLTKDDLTLFLEKIQTEAYKPYKTGLSFFDDLLGGGILQQSLLLLLAPPGTGKTTLCMQIAEEMANRKKPILYLNLEMSREQMIAKAISYRLAKSNQPKTAKEILQGYKWTDEDRQQIAEEIENYRKTAAKYIRYNPNSSIHLKDILADLEEQGQRAKAKGKEAPAIVLDYIHLVAGEPGEDTQETIKKTVKGLKDYAIRYNTFCIGVVAVGRASNNKISLSSGRDSSNLEYTADYQLSLNYDEVDKGNVSLDDVEAIQKEQGQKYRHMILRLLKERLDNPAKKKRLYYNAAHNIFYGENDWMPADPERIPFEGVYKQRKVTHKA